MRLLSWLIGLPLAILVVLFALSNRQTMAVGLWPFDEGLALPVFLAVLLPLLAGFLAGFLFALARGLGHRRAARRHGKRADRLQRELDALRAQAPATAAVPLTPPSVPTPPELPLPPS